MKNLINQYRLLFISVIKNNEKEKEKKEKLLLREKEKKNKKTLKMFSL